MGYFNSRRATVAGQHVATNVGLIGLCTICPPLWGPYVIATGFQMVNTIFGEHTPEAWAKHKEAHRKLNNAR